jgi:hypothetical protein
VAKTNDTDRILRFLLEGEDLSEGTIIIYNGAEGPEEHRPAVSAKEKPDQKSVTINGKKWRFKVNRDEDGQITDLDVEQL